VFILVLSYLADLIFGQPEKFFHPVRIIGWMTEKSENKFNNRQSILARRLKGANNRQSILARRLKGAVMAVTVIGITMCLAYVAIEISNALNPLLGILVSVYIAYTSFTIRELINAADDIFKALDKNSLVVARKNLAKIVTRDTKNLDEGHIVKSTIESTAENLNDSVVAPLFYLIIGGPVMAIGYRAANTLDAMVGYKTERYINFGWFSAKLDDVLNFIPARITGILICIAAEILQHNGRNSLKIMKRDGRKHESPNAGISEAAMSGALGIKLGGCYVYPNGKKKCREEIGEDNAKVEKFLIKKCVDICFTVSVLAVLAGIILKFFIEC